MDGHCRFCNKRTHAGCESSMQANDCHNFNDGRAPPRPQNDAVNASSLKSKTATDMSVYTNEYKKSALALALRGSELSADEFAAELATVLADAEATGVKRERQRCAGILLEASRVFDRCSINNEWTALLRKLVSIVEGASDARSLSENRHRDRAETIARLAYAGLTFKSIESLDANVMFTAGLLADALTEVECEALERAANMFRPSEPRPCDCERCDCGNMGDHAAVVAWDTQAGVYQRLIAEADRLRDGASAPDAVTPETDQAINKHIDKARFLTRQAIAGVQFDNVEDLDKHVAIIAPMIARTLEEVECKGILRAAESVETRIKAWADLSDGKEAEGSSDIGWITANHVEATRCLKAIRALLPEESESNEETA